MRESKNPLTVYGTSVKVKLVTINKSQEWLISEVKNKLPDKYIDHSSLNRIMIGKLNSKDIVSAINEILEL